MNEQFGIDRYRQLRAVDKLRLSEIINIIAKWESRNENFHLSRLVFVPASKIKAMLEDYLKYGSNIDRKTTAIYLIRIFKWGNS